MQLNAYRAFTQRLQTLLEQDSRVVGLVALGSMAERNRTPDDWSDHDFFVVTTPGVQETFRQDLRWLPDTDRIVLSIRETAHGLKVMYAEGHLIEFAVFDEAELRQHAVVNDYHILLDRGSLTGVLPAIVRGPSAPQGEYDPRRDFAMVLALIFVGAGRYARGERLSAHAFVKLYTLYHLLPLLTHLGHSTQLARLDNLDPFRRVEQAFPEAGIALEKILLLPVLEAGLALLDLAAQYAAPVLVPYPAEAVETVQNYVRKAGQSG